MNELALFTGIGGGLLASRLLGWKCICAVEIDEYCREILLQRQRDGVLDLFPIWDDAKTFDGRPWCGLVDVVSAGFPCQPFSVAGKRKGKEDERNLWPDTIRIIREVRPRFAFLENVPGLLSSGYFGTILGDLAESGYDARWRVLSAAEVGAPHKRDRLWILADAINNSDEWRQKSKREENSLSKISREKRHTRKFSGASDLPKIVAESQSNSNYIGVCREISKEEGRRQGCNTKAGSSNKNVADPKSLRWHNGISKNFWQTNKQGDPSCDSSKVLADPTSKRLHTEENRQKLEEEGSNKLLSIQSRSNRSDWWATEPNVGRVAHGIPNRVDRLKSLGNAQVSLVAATAWKLLNQELARQERIFDRNS